MVRAGSEAPRPACRMAGMRVAYIHTHMVKLQHTSASTGVIVDDRMTFLPKNNADARKA